MAESDPLPEARSEVEGVLAELDAVGEALQRITAGLPEIRDSVAETEEVPNCSEALVMALETAAEELPEIARRLARATRASEEELRRLFRIPVAGTGRPRNHGEG